MTLDTYHVNQLGHILRGRFRLRDPLLMTDFLDSSSLNNAPPFPPQNAAALTLQAKHRASSRKDGPLFSAPQLGPSRLSITSLAGRGGSTYPESARMRGALARGPAHPHKPGLRRLRRFFLALLPFAFVLHFALGKSQALPFIQGLRKTGFWGEWKGEDLQEGGVPHLAAESLRDRKALESRERWREIQLQGGWEAAKALGLTARGGESSKEIIVHGLERKSEEGGSGKRVGLAQPEDLDDDEDDDEDVNARSAMATDSPPIMEQQVAGSAEIEVRLEKAEFPQLKREQNAESARGNQGEAAGEEVQAVAAKGTVEQGEGRREESLRWQHLPEEGQRQEIAEGIEKEQKGGGGQDGQRRQQWLQEGQDRSARDFVDSAAQKQVSEEGKGESRGLSEGWAVDGDGGGVSAQALAGALAGGLKLGYAEGAGKIVEAGGEGEWGEETELERRAQLAEGAKRAAYGEVKSADVEKSAKSSKPRRYLYFGETIDDGQTGGLIHQVS